MTLLTEILRANRTKHRFSIDQLSLLLGCSRPQYERMERDENRFKPSQLTILSTIYNDNPDLYIDLQDVSLLLQKSGYDTNPDRAKRLLIAALQYITTSGKNLEVVVDSVKDDTLPKQILTQDRAERLREIIATQNQRLHEIEAEFKSITIVLTRSTIQSHEEKVSANRGLRVLVEESTSRSKLIDRLTTHNSVLNIDDSYTTHGIHSHRRKTTSPIDYSSS